MPLNLSDSTPPEDLLQNLDTLNLSTLEKLRAQSPALQSATGFREFLQQGMTQAGSSQARGLFGAMFTLPAVLLTAYQKIWDLVRGDEAEAFPEGTWQFYTQFGLREDSARHANETDGFHRALPVYASEVDQLTAWVSQCILMLFSYETLLENEWVERTLLRLIHEELAEAVVERLALARAGEKLRHNPAALQAYKSSLWQQDIERIEFETAQYKRSLNLHQMEWEWVKRRPYRRPLQVTDETYAQYRRRKFLEYLVDLSDRLSPQMGARIWDRYYDLASTALPAYQQQMSILFALQPERHQDVKVPIPLWRAHIAVIVHGAYFLIPVVQRDGQGRLLCFDPNKGDDPGQPLQLQQLADGSLRDQHQRPITIDRRGHVHIEQDQNTLVRVLRPLPSAQVKSLVGAILQQAQATPAVCRTDIQLVQTPRLRYAQFTRLLPPETQESLAQLDTAPIMINWTQRDRNQTLRRIRQTHRGLGNHALTIFRTDSSFIFDQSHIFFDAIWGMVISQIITDGAVDLYQQIRDLLPQAAIPAPPKLDLSVSQRFLRAVGPHQTPFEVTAETETMDLQLINAARKGLDGMNVRMTVNDLLTFYRTLHDQRYTPSVDLQRQLMALRLKGQDALVEKLDAHWRARRQESVSLLLPMDASFIDPKLRLFPATFRNFLPAFADQFEASLRALDEHTYRPSPGRRHTFLAARKQILENLLMLVEYFKMLKRITREGESLSTAAIRYLAHLPPGMQGTLDLIPQHVGALNEILKGEEVFSNVGRVDPSSSLVRFMSARDDGRSKVMVWGIMCDSRGNLKATLRDFRPHVPQLLALGEQDLAQLIVQDYLEAYARGLNQFADDLFRLTTAEV